MICIFQKGVFMNYSDGCPCKDSASPILAKDLPLAIAYVPMQQFGETFSLCQGLQAGTIFPELCLPFCGKGGACR